MFGFMMIPSEMLGDKRLEPLDMVVYAALDSFADSVGEAWPSLVTIAERGNVSRSTVTRALPRLIKAGYVAKELRRGGGKAGAFNSTMYRLSFRRGEAVSERDGAVSDGDARLCPSEIRVVSERHSNYNHITKPKELDCVGGASLTQASETLGTYEAHMAKVEELFDLFWESYPRKRNKGEARKAFMALFPFGISRERMNRRMNAINEQFAVFERDIEETLGRGEGRYIPYPHNWLVKEGFSDV
jgi:DNA-binding transcriptional ArsR family regulator